MVVLCSNLGVNLTVVSPRELFTDPVLLEEAKVWASASGAVIEVTSDLGAVKGADAVYTDVWVSMGEENYSDERRRLLFPYQVNGSLMDRTENPKAVFLHRITSYNVCYTKLLRGPR